MYTRFTCIYTIYTPNTPYMHHYMVNRYLAQHVKVLVALSPVSFMADQKSLLLGTVSRLDLGQTIYDVYRKGFLDGSQVHST